MKRTKTRALCEGAILVAAAQILGYIVLWRMPWGGSVCLSMLPIILYAHRWGLRYGLLAGFVLGILQYIGDNGVAISWISIIGDYLAAYTAVGLAGVFHGRKYGIFTGTLLGGLSRFVVAWVVGATVWASYMPETFFGMTMTTPWFYSLIYNGLYLGIDVVLCLVVFGVLFQPLNKYIRGRDLGEPGEN